MIKSPIVEMTSPRPNKVRWGRAERQLATRGEQGIGHLISRESDSERLAVIKVPIARPIAWSKHARRRDVEGGRKRLAVMSENSVQQGNRVSLRPSRKPASVRESSDCGDGD